MPLHITNDVTADTHLLQVMLAYGIQRENVDDSSDPLNITLGLELEFILAVNTYPDKACHENEDEEEAQAIIRDALSQPMAAKCATCGTEHAFHLKVHPTSSGSYHYWHVTEDSSLMISNDESQNLGENKKYLHFYDIEVTSRVLRPGTNFKTTLEPGTDHVHEITYLQEIDAVLERLHDFSIGPTRGNKIDGTHIVLNGSCGLHVHVGNGRRGFPLPTVKKILSTYVANERAIDSLHVASRIGGSRIAIEPLKIPFYNRNEKDLHQLPSAYNIPWSTQFAQTAHTLRRHRLGYNSTKRCLPRPSDKPVDHFPETHMADPSVGKAVDSFYVGDWLEVIDHAPNLKAIKELSYGRGTLSLHQLAPYKSKDKSDAGSSVYGDQMMTVEFRQHAGSLESAEIHAWMDVVVSMVTHAHNTPVADYKALSRNEWLQPKHGSIDLLKDIGCSLETKGFYRRKMDKTMQSLRPKEGTFAADVTEIDLSLADARIAPLLEYVERQRRQDRHPGNVADRIREKFRMGGYGKFSDEYLNQLGEFNLYDPHLGLRDKLSIDREFRG